jgi:hypothetical protein
LSLTGNGSKLSFMVRLNPSRQQPRGSDLAFLLAAGDGDERVHRTNSLELDLWFFS